MDLTKYYPDIVAKFPAYVTKRELCEICHICPKTAYNLEQQGEIPYTIEQNHLIRSHKIKLTDILAYLYRRECRQEADSPYICAMRTFYDEHLSPYWCSGNGSYHSLIPGAAEGFGLQWESISTDDPQAVVDTLASGKLIVALMSKGHFTSSGHFMVLRGVTSEGKILVADPASKKRSEQEWDISIILDEARKGAAAGGPLWAIY